MDVRQTQRLYYRVVRQLVACVLPVFAHVISAVRCFLVKMSNEYYNLWFRLDTRDAYLIWFEGEPDDVVVDADGNVPCFLNNEDLLRYAVSLNLLVKTESPLLHDLDFVAAWLEANDETVNCKNFLVAWNLFEDVSHSVKGNFDTDRKKTQKIYNKLFWGDESNVLTSEGESYTPTWTKRELKIIREVLDEGLSLFREKVSCV